MINKILLGKLPTMLNEDTSSTSDEQLAIVT